MKEKIYYFKTKHIPLPKKRRYYGSKRHTKYTKTPDIPPVAFIGGLYKTQVEKSGAYKPILGTSHFP